MAWHYYENKENGNSWTVPTRPGIPGLGYLRPPFFAENEAKAKIGIGGHREYVVAFYYEYLGVCIHFHIGARLNLDLGPLPMDGKGEASLFIGDIFAKSFLTAEEKSVFLNTATDPEVYNELFELCEYDLESRIEKIVVPLEPANQRLNVRPWSKTDNFQP